jgi:hypothetical protein
MVQSFIWTEYKGVFMKNRSIVAVFYLVGLTFLSLGISLMILADLGAGPWDAMYVGLNNLFGLSVGMWIFIVGILLIFINALLLRVRIDISAVIPVVTIGFMIDFWLLFVFANYQAPILPIRFAMLVGGVAVIAVGIACYLQSTIARNPDFDDGNSNFDWKKHGCIENDDGAWCTGHCFHTWWTYWFGDNFCCSLNRSDDTVLLSSSNEIA